MQIIKPPQELPDECKNEKITIFLAGSIEMGAAEDWQTKVEKRLSKYDIIIFNPRRDDWDSSWEQSIDSPNFVEQVEWELDALTQCTFIFMYFDPNTIAPISLLELGLYAEDGKMAVCCPDGYFRKGNVEIVCDRYLIRLEDTFEEALDNVEGFVVTRMKEMEERKNEHI